MTNTTKKLMALMAVTLLASAAWVQAAKGDKNVIETAMKKYHKAPKGTDPVCKKAQDGKATKEELHGLVECYKAMANAKPSKGDLASWKEKCAKLITTSEALEQGKPGAAAEYKAAVNCKACHSAHRGE